jgi:hypothetical protein
MEKVSIYNLMTAPQIEQCLEEKDKQIEELEATIDELLEFIGSSVYDSPCTASRAIWLYEKYGKNN